MSKIEWTEQTWNPIVGCSIVSPGCTNCYAMKMADRLQLMNATQFPHYQGTTKRVNGKPVWTGKMAMAPEATLTAPLRRRKPTMYFVNSMSDLFHEDVPDEWILQVLDVIRQASYDGGSNIGRIGNGEGQHTFQCLTKRSGRMRSIMSRLRWDGERLHLLEQDDGRARVLLKNLWLGVSAERQQEADTRVPDLLATPAAVRFVSAEPLLGPIDFTYIKGPNFPHEITNAVAGYTTHSGGKPRSQHAKLDWIIAGGESGANARPMHPDWARSIRDQCKSAGVAFFFKQWGNWLVGERQRPRAQMGPDVLFQDGSDFLVVSDGHDILLGAAEDQQAGPEHLWREYWGWQGHLIKPVGKARAGRLLDGREWNEYPAQRGCGSAPEAQRESEAAT